MKSGFHIIKTTFILLLVASLTMTGCKSKKVPKEVRTAEKAQAAEQKEAELEYKQAVKHHRDIQSEQTKQDMKALKKQQKKLNRIHRRSLWDRLFRPGCKTGK
ncbi:MAG: hypothetical protein GXO86_00980 [Chlorobi bacterium]|nr:hypothetical protein [Chlorobiota bacterium]